MLSKPRTTENYTAARTKLANNTHGDQYLAATEYIGCHLTKVRDLMDRVSFVKVACNATEKQAAKMMAFEKAIQDAWFELNA